MHCRLASLLLLLSAALMACGDAEPPASAPTDDGLGGKADEGAGAAAFEGRNDPAAAWLRKVTRADGTLVGDYQTVIEGIGAELGCSPESLKTFVILLSRKDYFPRNMFTACSDDPVKASKLFLSTQSDDGTLSDVDPRNLKLFAWDADARTYRLYELLPEGEDAMRVTVEPGHCRTCHTGPTSLDNRAMPFVPIMNELVNPWTLWNAEPDFRSHRFDELLDPAVAKAPVYTAMTGDGRLDSASNFERHIRESMGLVTTTRIRARRDPADLETSLSLLRPLFCDETLNYVSENHDNGELHGAAVIDDSIRRLYLHIQPDQWPWDWLNDGTLRLELPQAGQEPVAVLPVRGEATLQVENALVARRTLSAEQVLQVRALDWKRPTLSPFRCQLFLDGADRVRADPDRFAAYATNGELVGALFVELMQLDQGGAPLPLLSPTPGTLYAIPSIDADDALDAEALSASAVDLDGFGEQLQSWFEAIEGDADRGWLEQERARRGCLALAEYPAAPEIPGIGPCQD